VTAASDFCAAYVLHYTVYRDTSFIVDFFTLDHGRISLMARGGRSGKSNTRALYQPFRPLLISFVGNHELKTLSHIEESGAALKLLSEPLACGYYLSELLLRLLPKNQAQPMLFAHYAVALAELETGVDLEVVLRTFELQLLESIGLSPDFKHCTQDSSAVDPLQHYRFFTHNSVAVPIPESGITIEKVDPLLSEGIHADGVTQESGIEVAGATLHAIADLDFTDATVRAEAKLLMRHILRNHLGERPLKSRKMFSSYTSSSKTRSESNES
jgi:DNA repair protein RecO (recombination protein O)